MKLIAIDSSGLVAGVALLEDDLLLAEYTLNYKKTHSQTLLPMLDEIVGMTETSLSEVDLIAVAAGPGSFTGLRIGSATAKALGLALDKPLVEVPTLAALAYNLYGAKGLICPIMDARRSQVYNGLYRFEEGRLVTVRDQRPIPVSDLVSELNELDPALTKDGILFLGDGVPVYRDQIEEALFLPHDYAPAHTNRQRAASVGAMGLKLYEEKGGIHADEHSPIYLRASQAERERKAREHANS